MNNKVEDIELDVRNLHGWFELDAERLRGYIVALQNQGIITPETSNWLSLQVDNLTTHFKGLEIQYYKAKDLIKGGDNEQ